MEREVCVRGDVDARVRAWLEKRLPTEKGGVRERVERLARVLGEGKMVRAGQVHAGTWVDRLLMRPVVVDVEKVRGAVSTSVSVDQAKKGTLKGKVEIPNMFSQVLGINTVCIEGGLKHLKGSVYFGEIDQKKKEGNPVVYKWRGEGELGGGKRSFSMHRSVPGFTSPIRDVFGAEVKQDSGKAAMLLCAEKKHLGESARWTGRAEGGKETEAEMPGKAYVQGSVYYQKVLSLKEIPQEQVRLFMERVGLQREGVFLGVAVDCRAEAEGKMSRDVSSKAPGSMVHGVKGVSTLRVLVEKYGFFAGVEAEHRRVDSKPENRWSPVFGVFYAPQKAWMDTVDFLWSYKDVVSLPGMCKKIGSVSISVTKLL
ncbi:hypothetical protein NECID01_1243 [Nematocida sp. AWRm77]|nr:hypothetical protein NECID01_1243 [Nematocida sp. AWRm77]